MATTPDMAAFDSLFGDQGYEAFLSGLTTQGAPTAGLAPQTATPTATPERVLTEDEKKFGSYGTVKDIGNVNLSDVASVAEMAKRGGWADPYAFNTDMLTSKEPVMERPEVDEYYSPKYVQFKDPASRGITDTGRNLNRVEVFSRDEVVPGSGSGSGENFEPTTVNRQGYKVLAGAVPGTKNHTALYYEYDKDGKFMGANFDMEERGLEGAAPLINMAMMAIGAGAFGGFGGIGSSLAPGLGTVGQAAVGGAAVGGAGAALSGQNIGKGVVLGGVGGGLTAMNPAGLAGVDKAWQPTVNGAISGGTKALLTGQDPLAGAVSGGVNGSLRGLTKRNA